MRACMRCRRWDATGELVKQCGSMWLCPSCTAQGFLSQCGDFKHQYQGHTGGWWLCLRCGKQLSSVVVHVPGAAVVEPGKPDQYC